MCASTTGPPLTVVWFFSSFFIFLYCFVCSNALTIQQQQQEGKLWQPIEVGDGFIGIPKRTFIALHLIR